MVGESVPAVAIVLVALAVVFVAAAVRNYFAEHGGLSAARSTWLRMAFIFSAVAIGLFVWHTFVAS